MPVFDLIAFDADDTLWHNERLYLNAQAKLASLLATYQVEGEAGARLYQTESRNIKYFGYGIKSYTLSMIETAVELTQDRITARDVLAIIDLAREMLEAPVELLDQAAETVSRLSSRYRLMIITKGDLHDQETKVARSGLENFFQQIEIVSEKDRRNYERLLDGQSVDPSRFMMVGNSLRSDILPILELGGSAVYVPYPTTWQHEAADAPPPEQAGFYQLEHLGELPALLEHLEIDGLSPKRSR
jgi:putative hydrolase of the HAD superfamily